MISHPELSTLDGLSWITTPRFAAANSAALAPYKQAHGPLSRAWQGDDAANPTSTVALVFPDAITAQTVLVACGATMSAAP